MEQLRNEFTVNRPIGEAWSVLTDVERIAPCLPGAQLQEIEGDVYRGVVKVKLGAISTNFKGQASFVERDDTNHRATLKAEGRDTTGKGNANATIIASLTPVTATSATCTVTTELHVSGKIAQFSRGIMADVSKRLMAQFADNLNTMLDTAPPAATAPPATTADADDSSDVAELRETPAAASSVAEEQPTTSARPTVRTIDGPAAEPIELGQLAGTAILKRAVPFVAGLAVLMMIVRRLRCRR